jgi:mRNA interferase MazF
MEVMRGDLVTIALAGDYGKPRPALIVQAGHFAALPSITVLPLTSEIHNEYLIRILVEPSPQTGQGSASQIMVDKISTVPSAKVRGYIGQVDAATMLRVNRALAEFLGLA